jgi:CRP-like cAMP-binding protein
LAIGGSAAICGKIAVHRAIVQLEGEGYVCDGRAFKALTMQRPALLTKIIRYERTLYIETQQSAACTAKHQVEAKVACWMLRARDLMGSDYLPFTQEFLAEMLGVRRTSVSGVAKKLHEAGVIEYSRGKIKIINITKLKDASCECYETVRRYSRNLLG